MPRIFSKEVDDAIYATLKVENGLQGQLSVCWSDDTHRKMTTSLKIEGDKGKLEADATTLKIYLKEDNEKLMSIIAQMKVTLNRLVKHYISDSTGVFQSSGRRIQRADRPFCPVHPKRNNEPQEYF